MARLTVNEGAMQGWTDSITLTSNSFSGTSAGAETINYAVKKGDIVKDVLVNAKTAFAGVGTAVIDIGDGSDTDGYVDNQNVATTGVYYNTNGALFAASSDSQSGDVANGLNGHLRSADGNINITITTGSDGLADATAGEVEVKFCILRAEA